MPQRLKPYNSRIPTRFEMAFSLGVVLIVFLLGLLILIGVFGISPGFRVTLGIILLGYGLIRFWMLKSGYEGLKRKEESLNRIDKEDDKNLRNF
ncbi:MAG: hypothetical protein KAW02_03905 [candidate division Zixibacteria bacterium]|nr:hypothetical protein [candidate division Zixibacteria bacterium]